MRQLNAFLAGVFLYAALSPSHERLWLDALLVLFGTINGMNAVLGPKG